MKGPFWSGFHYFLFFTLITALVLSWTFVHPYWGVLGGLVAGVYGYRKGDPSFDWGDE